MLNRIVALVSPHWVFRSSITGRFVGKWYALTHPKTTLRERVGPRDSGDLL